MIEQLRIAQDDACLEGHFPGHPIVPAVVILDAVVDAAERAFACRIAAIERCRFRHPLHPEQSVELEVEAPEQGRARFWCRDGDVELARGRIRVADPGEHADRLD